MAVTKIYHPFRKWALRQIAVSAVLGFGLAELFWQGYAVPKVERRNHVMSLIEKERQLKNQALDQATAELSLPAQGSITDIFGATSA